MCAVLCFACLARPVLVKVAERSAPPRLPDPTRATTPSPAYQWFQAMACAAVRIQRIWRGYSARRRFEALLEQLVFSDNGASPSAAVGVGVRSGGSGGGSGGGGAAAAGGDSKP